MLVDRLRLSTVPQATLVPIALGFVLAKRGKLEEAETELEAGLSVRREFATRVPWPEPWPTCKLGVSSLGVSSRGAAVEEAHARGLI